MPKLKTIKPFPKEFIPEGNRISGIHAMSDGGVLGYSSIIYITSESMTKELTSRVCGTKGRVSKRKVPANKALSRALQADQVKQVAMTLSHRPELENTELSIVMAGDSICVSTLYNPGLNIKNILL